MWIKVLIIEDDEVLNEMYTMKFNMEWFIVEVAYDWFSALEKLNIFKPDVVLLDIMMPWINWMEVLPKIKEMLWDSVKIIMFTNLNDKNNMEKALEMWASDFILKADTTPKQAVEKVRALF